MPVTVIGPPKGLRTIECTGCYHQLQYAPKDVRECPADWDEGEPAYKYITCPRSECGKRTVIKDPPDDYDI